MRVKSTYNGSNLLDGEQIYKKQNSLKSMISGVETQLGYQINDNFLLKGNINWLYGQDVTNNKPMRRIPPLNGLLAVKYQKNKFYTESELLFASKQTRLSGGDIDDHRIPDGGTSGFSIINVKAGYRFNYLSIYTKLQNLLDKNYRMHGSGVDGYGRSAWIALKVEI